jgi:hypothetical protein
MRPDRHDEPESLFAIMRTRQKQINDFSTAHQTGGAAAQAAVTGLSPRSPAFDPKPFYVEFAVDKAALGRFVHSTSVCPCQYHSTTAPHSPSSTTDGKLSNREREMTWQRTNTSRYCKDNIEPVTPHANYSPLMPGQSTQVHAVTLDEVHKTRPWLRIRKLQGVYFNAGMRAAERTSSSHSDRWLCCRWVTHRKELAVYNPYKMSLK